MNDVRDLIEKAWDDRDLLKQEKYQNAVEEVVSLLDKGELRVAEPDGDDWKVNDWVKKGVVLYFPLQKMETIEVGPFEYHDKIPVKRNYAEQGVRVVPQAIGWRLRTPSGNAHHNRG